LPLSFLAFVGAISSTAVLAAWVLYGRSLLRPAALVQVPLYLLWKLPLYLRILTQRESRWVRTRRS